MGADAGGAAQLHDLSRDYLVIRCLSITNSIPSYLWIRCSHEWVLQAKLVTVRQSLARYVWWGFAEQVWRHGLASRAPGNVAKWF